MKELFDKKFVHIMWDDSLKGKRGFFADGINELIGIVNTNLKVRTSSAKYNTTEDTNYPFESANGTHFKFFYYDPNYECKRAYAEGKQIQYFRDDGIWCDCAGTPEWYDDVEYRIKSESESKRMTYRQLAEWLAKGNGQLTTGFAVSTQLSYSDMGEKDNRELPNEFAIRPWGSDKWIEPTVEVYLKDCVKKE